MQWLPQNETGYAIGWTVIHSLWQGLLLAIIIGCILIAIKHKSPTYKSALLMLTMALMPIISIVTFFVVYPQRYVNPTLLRGTALEGLPSPPSLEEPVINMAGDVISNLSVSNLALYINNHLYLILTIWLVGVGLSILRLLSGITYVHYLKTNFTQPLDEYWLGILDDVKSRLNVSDKSIQMMESALVKSPIIIGHIKPIILMPIGIINQLSDKQVEAILSHEVAHILRKDYLVNILQNIVESLYYFHPAMWWISSQLRDEREKCCDDLAIEACGDKITYIKALVSMQELAHQKHGYVLSFAGNSKESLFDRVNRLVQPKREILTIQEKLYASGTLIALLLMFQLPIIKNPKTIHETNHLISYYLKYDNNNELDSLRLSFPVDDGVYRREDDLQNVVLEVEKNKVVKFMINGLSIAGNDMEKFQKMIESIVTESANQGDINTDDRYNTMEVISENISSDKITIIDKDQNQHELITTDAGDYILKVTNKENKTTLFESKNGDLFMNNKPCQLDILYKHGWNLGPMGFERLNESPRSKMKKTNDSSKKIPSIININSNDTVKVSVCQNDAFQKWASDYLLENGIVKPKQDYSYMLNYDRLIVNGIILTDEVKKLWQNKYASVNNVKFDNSTYVTGNFTY